MKLGKRYLACLVLAVVMVVSLGLFAACNNNNNQNSSDGGSANSTTSAGGSQSTDTQDETPSKLKGDYYTMEDGKEYTLAFEDAMKVTLNLANGANQATFAFDGAKATWTHDGKSATAELSADGNKLNVKVGSASYTFWRKIDFDVKFTVDGEVKKSSQTLNGAVPEKPADPEKEGFYFVGWYKDAGFEESYSFETDIVTADTTIYGRFVQYAETEFKVNFDLCYEGAETLESTQTVGHKLYSLPVPQREGYRFVGWWTSNYDSAEKLTAQYIDQDINVNNTTLYAVWDEENAPKGLHISFSSKGISWKSVGVNETYKVTISREDPAMTEATKAVQKLEYTYDMSGQMAGDYVVKVETSDQTAYAYYKNKALDAVSLFEVDETGTILTWNAVENATSYTVTYECAGAAHIHKDYPNGNSTNFNFKNCDMPEGGYKFVVKASSDGYSTSTSAEFAYSAQLTAAKNLAVADGSKLTWDAVKNAQFYEVKIGEEKFYTLSNEFSLENLTGELNIEVTAKARTFAPSVAASLQYTRAMLVAPQNLTVNGGTVAWDAVSGATSYVVTVDGNEHQVATNEFTLEDTHYDATKTTHTLFVQAMGADTASKSLKSKEINFTANTVAPLTYEDGKLYWAVVDGATGYVVTVNDTTLEPYGANSYCAEVALTQSGVNTIKVAYLDADGVKSVEATLTVEAVALKLDLGTGESIEDNTLYLEKGSLVNLDDIRAGVIQDSFSFAGWYDVRGGRTSNAARYYDEVPVVLNSDMTLYATWLGEERRVTLDPEGSDLPDGAALEYIVRVGEPFELPVPTSEDATKIFVGWYSEPNGVGVSCTNEKGQSGAYTFYTNRTFYPCWKDIFKFVEISKKTDGTPTAYSVMKGDALNLTKEVTVPVKHKGLPVTTIEANGFKDCKNLVSFNIPNTIKNVERTALVGCTNLVEVNVYSVEGVMEEDIIYESFQGVLFRRDKIAGGKEVALVPDAKEGAYEIPYGVTTIPMEAFKAKKITELKIPATVTYIGTDAFYNSTYPSTTKKVAGFDKIEFLPQIEGKDEVPLELAIGAFNYCRKIKQLTLPTRMKMFDNKDRFFFDLFYAKSSFYTELTDVNIEGNPAVNVVKNADGSETKTPYPHYTSKDGIVYADDGTTLIYYPTYREGENFETDPLVSKIADYAVYYNRKIKKITISFNITSIGKCAFKDVRNTRELVFQGTADDQDLYIGEEAFCYNWYLKETTLPANVKQIDKYAFAYCDDLETLNVQFDSRIIDAEGKVLIDENTFANKQTSTSTSTRTTYIITLHLGKNVPVIDINSIFGGSKLETLTVDPLNPNYGTVEGDTVLYGKDANGNLENIAFFPLTRTGDYVVPTGVKTIGAYALQAKTGVTSITIPHTVTSIGNDAFRSCSALASVTFLPTPEGEEASPLTIGSYVFASCPKLLELSFPERTISLGDGLINASNNIATINLPASLTELVASVDANGNESMKTFYAGTSTKLSSINVAAGNKKFASIDGILYAMKEVPAEVEGGNPTYVPSELIICPLQNEGNAGVVTIPASVTRIWDNAFTNNILIEKILFAQRTSREAFSLGKNVFDNMANLTQLELPLGLTRIDTQAIKGCPLLTVLRIPQTVSYVGTRAFYNLAALEQVIFIDDTAEDENKAVDLVFANGSTYSTSYHTGIFYDTDALKSITLPVRGHKAPEKDEEGNTPDQGKLAEITVGHSAFTDLPAIETIKLTDNVVSLGDFAFERSVLKTIDLPDSIKTIGKSVFAYTNNLTSIKLPSGITEIPERAFYYSKVKEFTVGANVKVIAKQAFGYARELVNVVFEKSTTTNEDGTTVETTALTDIADSAFDDCKALLSIDLPDTLKTIGVASFDSTGLTSISIPASVETIGERAFTYSRELKEVIFEGTSDNKSQLKTIGKNAFQSTAIESFAFPASVNNLTFPDPLFGTSNSTLKSVYLSESVIDIGMAFSGCTAIERMTVSDLSENFYADPNNPYLLSKNKEALRFYYGDIQGTINLFNVDNGDGTFSSTIIEIGDRVFEQQTGLTSIAIPKTVTKIGQQAFRDCSNLATVTFEQGSMLNSIGIGAFYKCTALKEIRIPKLVSRLAGAGYDPYQTTTEFTDENPTSRIFSGCSSLQKVTFEEGSVLQEIGRYTFENCKALATFVIPDTVKTLGEYAFTNCNALTEVTIPAGLELSSTATRNEYWFNRCSSLTTVHFPATTAFTVLPKYTFYYCENLANSTIGGEVQDGFAFPETITEIGDYAFQYCSGLEKVSLGKVQKINQYAFKSTGIKKIVFPETITNIGSSAFASSLLEEVKLPASLTDSGFGTYVFQDCLNLATVDFTAATNLTKIPNYTFDGCKALKHVKDAEGNLKDFAIPDNITELGNSAFRDCTFEKIVIPATITKIGSSAFADNDNLVSIDYQAAVLGSYMFQSCDVLTTIKLADDIDISSASSAFYYCKLLKYSRYENENDYDLFKIPANATKIPSSFLNGSGITEIVIPNSVTEIGGSAFAYCKELTKVTFPDAANCNVVKLGYSIFNGCEKLVDVVNMPSTVTDFGSTIFSGTAIETFTVPKGWTKVPSSLFSGSEKLKTVIFEDGSAATIIDTTAFKNCTALKEITIPASVTKIASNSFNGCTALEKVNIVDPSNIDEFGWSVFDGCSSLKEIVLPRNFNGNKAKINTNMYDNIFRNCTSLEKVTFHPDTVLSIVPEGMFMNCTSLKSITLPDTIDEIDFDVFNGCTALTEVIFENPNILQKIGKGAFKGCSSLTSMNLPSTLSSIAESAFEGCSSLATFTIGSDSTITEIPKNAFKGTASLATFKLPSSVTKIADSAFEGSGITAIEIPEPVSSIGTKAFYNCANLASVNFLGNNVKKILSYTFAGTSKLTSIKLPAAVTEIGDRAFEKSGLVEFAISSAIEKLEPSAFSGCANLTNLTASLSNQHYKVEDYKLMTSDGTIILVLSSYSPENGAITITKDMKFGPKPFDGNNNITSIVFADGVEEVAPYLFYNVDSLVDVVLPATIKQVGAYAFAECDNLKTFTMPDTLTTLGTITYKEDGTVDKYEGGVFAGTKSLTSFTFGAGVTEVFPNLFEGSSLTTVVLPDSIVKIHDGAFLNLKKLTSVTFNKTLKSIGKYAFSGCTALTSLNITGNELEIGELAFGSKSSYSTTASSDKYDPMVNLKEVTLGDGVKSVGKGAFRGTGVETVNFGASVEFIDQYAFYGLESLANVNFTDNGKLHTIYDYAFTKSGVKNVVLPEGLLYLGKPTISDEGKLTDLGSRVFQYCKSLESVTFPDSLRGIGFSCFEHCEALTSLHIPELEFIDSYAFEDCLGLKTVYMEDGTKELSSRMFEYCAALEEIRLPETLEVITSGAFYGCTGLKELYVPKTVKEIGANAFYNFAPTTTIYFVGIPKASADWDSSWNSSCSANIVFNAQPKPQAQP